LISSTLSSEVFCLPSRTSLALRVLLDQILRQIEAAKIKFTSFVTLLSTYRVYSQLFTLFKKLTLASEVLLQRRQSHEKEQATDIHMRQLASRWRACACLCGGRSTIQEKNKAVTLVSTFCHIAIFFRKRLRENSRFRSAGPRASASLLTGIELPSHLHRLGRPATADQAREAAGIGATFR